MPTRAQLNMPPHNIETKIFVRDVDYYINNQKSFVIFSHKLWGEAEPTKFYRGSLSKKQRKPLKRDFKEDNVAYVIYGNRSLPIAWVTKDGRRKLFGYSISPKITDKQDLVASIWRKADTLSNQNNEPFEMIV